MTEGRLGTTLPAPGDDERDAVVAEAFGTADDAQLEVYGVKPRGDRRRPQRRAAAQAAPPRERNSYRVTADARIMCECGVYNYTEPRNGRPPALPTECWRCGSRLDAHQDRS